MTFEFNVYHSVLQESLPMRKFYADTSVFEIGKTCPSFLQEVVELGGRA